MICIQRYHPNLSGITMLSLGRKLIPKSCCNFSCAKDHMTFIHLLSQKRTVEGIFSLRCRWTNFGQTVKMVKKQWFSFGNICSYQLVTGKGSPTWSSNSSEKIVIHLFGKINNHVKLPSEKLMAGTWRWWLSNKKISSSNKRPFSGSSRVKIWVRIRNFSLGEKYELQEFPLFFHQKTVWMRWWFETDHVVPHWGSFCARMKRGLLHLGQSRSLGFS